MALSCYQVNYPELNKDEMMNYDKLRMEFTEELNSYDKESLLKWIEQDEKRLFFEGLLTGEINVNAYSAELPHQMSDPRENIDYEYDVSAYALAA